MGVFMDYKELVKLSLEAKQKSYSPYSNFKVGAALLTKDFKVYMGANIENAAYTPTNCAERTAFFKAVFDGARDFKAIAVCGSLKDEEGDYCYPCGVCRQVMIEFCDKEEFEIIVVKDAENYKVYKLKELLPFGFSPLDLQ